MDHANFKSGTMANRKHLPLLVMKFGGAALSGPKNIKAAAQRIIEKLKSYQVIVVVSAMGDETDRLIEMTKGISDSAHLAKNLAEIDTVLASGEQVAAGLMALALSLQGAAARSFLAHQLPIVTDGNFSDGQILQVETRKLTESLDNGIIPVVAGFQGVDDEGRLVTLGRGGSDTSAVFIAAALGAETCELYKDIDAVYSEDPRRVPTAERYRFLSYAEMEQIATREPQILHHKAVAMAKLRQIRLHVRSAFKDISGTIIETPIMKITKIKMEEASA